MIDAVRRFTNMIKIRDEQGITHFRSMFAYKNLERKKTCWLMSGKLNANTSTLLSRDRIYRRNLCSPVNLIPEGGGLVVVWKS